MLPTQGKLTNFVFLVHDTIHCQNRSKTMISGTFWIDPSQHPHESIFRFTPLLGWWWRRLTSYFLHYMQFLLIVVVAHVFGFMNSLCPGYKLYACCNTNYCIFENLLKMREFSTFYKWPLQSLCVPDTKYINIAT